MQAIHTHFARTRMVNLQQRNVRINTPRHANTRCLLTMLPGPRFRALTAVAGNVPKREQEHHCLLECDAV